jgi:hypothetical protein
MVATRRTSRVELAAETIESLSILRKTLGEVSDAAHAGHGLGDRKDRHRDAVEREN